MRPVRGRPVPVRVNGEGVPETVEVRVRVAVSGPAVEGVNWTPSQQLVQGPVKAEVKAEAGGFAVAVAGVFNQDGFEVGGGTGGGESGEGGGDLVPLDGGLAEDDIAEVEGVVGRGEDSGAGAAEVHEG